MYLVRRDSLVSVSGAVAGWGVALPEKPRQVMGHCRRISQRDLASGDGNTSDFAEFDIVAAASQRYERMPYLDADILVMDLLKGSISRFEPGRIQPLAFDSSLVEPPIKW